jgi:hypothetical protein
MFNHVESYPLRRHRRINDSALVNGEIPYVPGDSVTSRLLAARTADTAPVLPVMAIDFRTPAGTVTTGWRVPHAGLTPRRTLEARPAETTTFGKHRVTGQGAWGERYA